jgi:hypothetical protein
VRVLPHQSNKFATSNAAPAVMLLGLIGLRLVPTRWLRVVPWVCPVRLLLDADCPACGITRSMAEFAHGRVRPSLHHHPFGPLVYIAATATALVSIASPDATPAQVVERAYAYRPVRIAVGIGSAIWIGWAIARVASDRR